MKKRHEWPGFFLFFLCYGLVYLYGQKAELIRNPAEPLYGEISLDIEEDLTLGNDQDDHYLFFRVWDIQADTEGNIFVLDSGATRIQKYSKNGEYLGTIGRKGQGPGEFERPFILALDKDNNLYVGEMSKIHTFDPEGKFVRTTKIPFFFMNFVPDNRGNFVVTGRITIEGGQNLGVMTLDSNGKIKKTIKEFPGLPMHETGMTISHDYSPEIRFTALADRGFVYGYNLDYQIYVAGWAGNDILIFRKEEPAQIISRKEKNKIIDDLSTNARNAGLEWPKNVVEKMANIPENRPFFDRIRADEKGRIYIRQRTSILDKSGDMTFDIFGKDGYYLYKTKLPFVPMSIRDGFMYHATYVEESGEVKVKRYRINNEGRMRSARN